MLKGVFVLEWLIRNWTLLVFIGAAIGVVMYYGKKFSSLPSEDQLKKVKEWLLYAVIIAEKEYQSGTGVLKLRSVYDAFLVKFPSLVTVISFELFSQYVDEALVEMKRILETNKDIEAYVEGLNK